MSVVRSALALCLLVVVLLPTAPAVAQLSSFALPHPFALPGATTARLFGMGGFASCIQDDGFANPAYAALVTDQQAVARYSVTDFDGGVTLKGEQISLAVPVETGRKGMQITAFRLDSEAGGVDFGSGPGTMLSANEWDLSLHWGQKADDDWYFGVAVSPAFHSRLDAFAPLSMPPSSANAVTVLRTRSTRDWGYRLGGIYRLGDRGWVGAIYDKYREHVDFSGMAVGGNLVRVDFSSDAKYLGVSYRLNPRLLGAAEWQQLSTAGGGEWAGDSGIRCGLEYAVSDRWTVRSGSNDGAFSAGLGYQGKNLGLRYAYVKDWNDDLVGSLLGSSDTHQFELVTGW